MPDKRTFIPPIPVIGFTAGTIGKRSSAPSSASGMPAQTTTAKATTKPVQRTQPQPNPTDQMVQEVIQSVRAEKAERQRREDEYQLNQRRLLAQVAGCDINDVHLLIQK